MCAVIPSELIERMTVQDLPPLTMEYCVGGDLRSVCYSSGWGASGLYYFDN